MKFLIKSSFLFSFIIIGVLQHSQGQLLDSMLNVYRDSMPQEKIYVHFDKNYYNPGESIWFKAYLFAGLEPSIVSKNFYAELIDENGAVLNKSIGPVIESSSAGNFDLSPTLSKNILYFRAYTVNMLNDDTAFLFLKPIHIVIPSKKQVNKTELGTRIVFLPEGGDLVAGLSGIVGFKVTDQNGMPATAKGYIKGKDGQKLVDFATVHDGMGTFYLEPKAEEVYAAQWKDVAGKEQSSPLPPVRPEGVNVQVGDFEGAKRFVLQRTQTTKDESLKTLKVIGVMNQHLVYSARANMSVSATTSGLIPTAQLPSGVLQVTVFDKNDKPLAERVTFVNNHEYEFDGDAWIPGLNTAKRGLNNVEVLINDTVRSNLSLSITDADINIPSQYEDNIISHLLLTGELRGKIANPYYYFFNTSDSARIYLDLVMLTHGWRRYNWDNILAGKLPAGRKKESNYLSINGQLIGITPGRISTAMTLNGIMQTKDSNSVFLALPVDRKGQLHSDGFVFYEYAKLFFQFRDQKQSFDKSMLKVENGLWRGYPSVDILEKDKQPPANVDSTLWARNIKIAAAASKIASQRVKKEQMLQEVIVRGKVKTTAEKMDQKYSSGLFSGGDARNFDVANDPFAVSSMSVFQYLQGKVAGLQISTGPPASLTWRGSTPTFYLDEMSVDKELLSTINMADVGYIKVFSPGSAGGIANSGGGAIVVYTKKGNDANNSKGKGLEFIQIPGYTALKQFYAPDYATPGPLTDLDDVRTTLLWNPFIFTDKKTRRFKFRFYNSDITRRFRLILEGVNDDGKLIHIEKIIQ